MVVAVAACAAATGLAAARGAIVDTDALIEALSAGRIRAALDVTDPEPLPPGQISTTVISGRTRSSTVGEYSAPSRRLPTSRRAPWAPGCSSK